MSWEYFSAALSKAPDAAAWPLSSESTESKVKGFLILEMHRENVHLGSESVHSTDGVRNILVFALQFTVQMIQFSCDVF